MSAIYGEIIEEPVDKRPRWVDVYMTFAHILSKRSTCSRASVGCVITSWDYNRMLAIGYNGNYKGAPNKCDSDEPGKCGCLHAEENAIIKLDFNDHVRKRLYTTTSPCKMCAKRIINAGIDYVVYPKLYRSREGIDLLQNNGVQVIMQQDIKIPGVDLKDLVDPTYLGEVGGTIT
jgi:dCMP deaminase